MLHNHSSLNEADNGFINLELDKVKLNMFDDVPINENQNQQSDTITIPKELIATIIQSAASI